MSGKTEKAVGFTKTLRVGALEPHPGQPHEYAVLDRNCALATVWGGDDTAENYAHLFAAAPEMYEALMKMVSDDAFADLCEGIGEEPTWLKLGRTALAKAEGRQAAPPEVKESL